MGMMCEEDNQYGPRVSWYKLAMERFDESLRAAEDIGIEDTLAFTRDVIGEMNFWSWFPTIGKRRSP